MAIEFDPINKRIILDVASTSASDLYSRSCDWLAIGDNAKYGAIFRQVGGDDLGGGLLIPPYFFLQGDWRVRPMETDHDLSINGNLFVESGGSPFVRTIGAYQVSIRSTVPVQAQGFSTTGGSSGPTANEIATAVRASLSTELMKVMLLENGLTSTQATMLSEIYALYGLDPMAPLIVSNTSRVAGSIAQTIAAGSTQTVITRQ